MTVGLLLFALFIALMLIGAPIGVALAIGGATAIAIANVDVQWFSLLAVPQNFYAGMAKYPLLAIPMFVLLGVIFDRSGVAQRLVDFAVAIVGRGPGMLPLVAIAVAMFLGGISGSGPANAAAVGDLVVTTTADTVDGVDSTGFNLGGVYDFSPQHHLLFSAGTGLQNASETNTFSYYLGYQYTF